MAHRVMSILLLTSLTACSSHPAGSTGTPGNTVADGSEFNLQPGEAVTLADDSQLRYLRLVADSRCPPDVQCVWAGDAIVAFQWTSAAGAAQDFELHTGVEPRTQAIGTRSVTLKSLARGAQPEASLVVNAGQ